MSRLHVSTPTPAVILRTHPAVRQMGGLRHPLLAINPPMKAQERVDPADFGARPGSDLIKMKDAEFVETLRVDRTDAPDALKIVDRAARRVEGERPDADGVGPLLGRCGLREPRQRLADVSLLGSGMRIRDTLVERGEVDRTSVRGRLRDGARSTGARFVIAAAPRHDRRGAKPSPDLFE